MAAKTKRKSTKRKSTKRKSTKAKGRPRKARGRSASVPRLTGERVRLVESSIQVVGVQNLRGGRVLVGGTSLLTPTRQGFKALDSFLLALQRSTKTSERVLYTFDLQFRYKGLDGRMTSSDLIPNLVFPDLETAKQKRFKGESVAAAWRRLVETQVKSATFRGIESNPEFRGGSAGLKAKLETVQNVDQARRILRDFKASRQFKFRLTVHRVLS